MAEIASARVRAFPSTRRRLKVDAARLEMTLAELLEELSLLAKKVKR